MLGFLLCGFFEFWLKFEPICKVWLNLSRYATFGFKFELICMQNLVWICIDMPQILADAQKFGFDKVIMRIFWLKSGRVTVLVDVKCHRRVKCWNTETYYYLVVLCVCPQLCLHIICEVGVLFMS